MRYEEFVRKTIEEFIQDGKDNGLDFPDIDLYADQAASFLNKRLSLFCEDEGEGVITKAMIGNYTKHNIIPHPIKKKYTKEHLMLLNMVYYLKGLFQMSEIELLMAPIIENYNSEFDEEMDLTAVCEGIVQLQRKEREDLEQRVWTDVESIKKTLQDAGMSDDDMLEIFMLIINLAVQADTKRYLARKLMKEYFSKIEKTKKDKK